MEIINDIESLKEMIGFWKRSNLKIGFVPTMGYLHNGHGSLVNLAKTKASKIIVSIFVNPTQFNDPEDLKKYPIDLPRDFSLLKELNVDAVFVPTPAMIYGADFESWVELIKLPNLYEGGSRPGHFKGVSTVVTILFNLVEPDFAVFGEKDFQQLRIIETMVKDLKMNIEILRGPTVREADGLAMSSRNVKLSKETREIAPEIFKALSLMQDAVKKGERLSSVLWQAARSQLAKFPDIEVDYLSIVREKDLISVNQLESSCRVLFAGYLNKIRLIDNLRLF